MLRFFRSLFFSPRFFSAWGVVVALAVLGYLVPWVFALAKVGTILILAAALSDLVVLYSDRRGVQAARQMGERLSNGDENEIALQLTSYYRTTLQLEIIDEIPHQFQVRDILFSVRIAPGETTRIRYSLRPVKRGEYSFGAINVFAVGPLGLGKRKIRIDAEKTVPVYPSFIQMRHYELLAISNRLTEAGIKKIRRIGHNLEFEQIKKYVGGDDVRTINWKATARKAELMVNHYQDERMQQVFSLIDKGRLMQMPFEGMSLLDYAINASLVISNIAIKKSDKAGLITFQDQVNTFLPAGRVNHQMSLILQTLYNQKTSYREADFSALHASVRRRITQRSLLLLFTNFETVHGLQRQMRYLMSLNASHLLVVIFFENTEMKALIEEEAGSTQRVYDQAVAERLAYEKRLIVQELRRHGIQSILTPPQRLTVNTINKYLELKARNLI